MQTLASSVANIAVPFLPQRDIELEAMKLLADFGGLRNRGKLKPPVPVEDVLEKHLKLTLDFDDLHGRQGIPGVAKSRIS